MPSWSDNLFSAGSMAQQMASQTFNQTLDRAVQSELARMQIIEQRSRDRLQRKAQEKAQKKAEKKAQRDMWTKLGIGVGAGVVGGAVLGPMLMGSTAATAGTTAGSTLSAAAPTLAAEATGLASPFAVGGSATLGGAGALAPATATMAAIPTAVGVGAGAGAGAGAGGIGSMIVPGAAYAELAGKPIALAGSVAPVVGGGMTAGKGALLGGVLGGLGGMSGQDYLGAYGNAMQDNRNFAFRQNEANRAYEMDAFRQKDADRGYAMDVARFGLTKDDAARAANRDAMDLGQMPIPAGSPMDTRRQAAQMEVDSARARVKREADKWAMDTGAMPANPESPYGVDVETGKARLDQYKSAAELNRWRASPIRAVGSGIYGLANNFIDELGRVRTAQVRADASNRTTDARAAAANAKNDLSLMDEQSLIQMLGGMLDKGVLSTEGSNFADYWLKKNKPSPALLNALSRYGFSPNMTTQNQNW